MGDYMARSGSLLEDGVGEVRHKSASVKPEFGRIRMLGREIDPLANFLGSTDLLVGH